ncbi:hypothetical protein [Pseudaestuariivita sp.]|uniref:hypothetical protein n=1 Tax=Pseudaestuariivita sp. TaxID=2211669 RepID=UPI004058925D
MRRFGKLLGRLLLAALIFVLILLAPVGYVELACRPQGTPAPQTALVDPEHHRPEARTLLTYPEWHIVHAYDDYAEVIASEDPHDYAYLRGIAGYWTSLCDLTRASGTLGPVDTGTKQMVYVIGVSFTAELLFKALYEETIGRVVTWLRGSERAPLDDLSAKQARAYAQFLQQVPWYRYDFAADADALRVASTGSLRDSERAVALGLEYGAKQAYAGVIEEAVASVGPDALRLRMVVNGVPAADLGALDGVDVITPHARGIEIETPRYRELTGLMLQMSEAGAEFVEIAGNDTILFTAISSAPIENAMTSLRRQGYGDWRNLILVPVAELAPALRNAEGQGLTIEHIHDY